MSFMAVPGVRATDERLLACVRQLTLDDRIALCKKGGPCHELLAKAKERWG